MIFTTIFLITFFPWSVLSRRGPRASVARNIIPTDNSRRDSVALRAEWRLNESGYNHLGRRFKHARRLIQAHGPGQIAAEIFTLPPGGEIIVTGAPAVSVTTTPHPSTPIVITHPPSTTLTHPPVTTTSRAAVPTTSHIIPTSTHATSTTLPTQSSSTTVSETTSSTDSSTMSTPLMNDAAVTGDISLATSVVTPTGTSGAAGPNPLNPNIPNAISQSAPQPNFTGTRGQDGQTFANPLASQTTSSDSSHQTNGIAATPDSHSSTESNLIIIIIGCLILGALILGGSMVLIWRWRKKVSRAPPKDGAVPTQAYAFSLPPSEGLGPRKHTELPTLVTLPYSSSSFSPVSEYRVSDYQVHTPHCQNSPSTDLGHICHIRGVHHIRSLPSAGETDSQVRLVGVDRMDDDLPEFRPPDYASLHSGRGNSYYVVSHPHA